MMDFLVRPSLDRVSRLKGLLNCFFIENRLKARMFLKLLGHMTSLEKLVPWSRIRIRPVQFYLQDAWEPERDLEQWIVTSAELGLSLQWWRLDDNLRKGQRIRDPQPDLLLFSDSSSVGWGAHLGDLEAQGVWSTRERQSHLSILELRAVFLALQAFKSTVQGKAIVAMTDNTTVVGYITNQGGTHSRVLNDLTRELLDWACQNKVWLSARHVPGRLNTRADCLNRANQLLPGEWALNPHVCQQLWKVWGRPMVDLFATRDNHKLPLFYSPMQDDLSVGTDALSQRWDGMLLFAYPPASLISSIIRKLEESVDVRLVLVALNWPSQAWFPYLLDLLVDAPRVLPLSRTLLKQGNEFHKNLEWLNLHAWILSPTHSEQRVFSGEAADRMSQSNRPSTARLYQAKWDNFARWCSERGTDPCKATLPVVADFMIFLRDVKKFSVPTIKGYRSALSRVLRPQGIDLSASTALTALTKTFAQEWAKEPQTRLHKWNLLLVLASLLEAPYEPLESADIQFLCHKTTFLLVFASAKRFGVNFKP